MAQLPTITKMRAEHGDYRPGQAVRYRITGGDLAPEWAAAVAVHGRPAWCEVTIWPDGRVGSYGGEVWPTAWPELFGSTGTQEWPRGPAHTPAGLRLTEAGRAAFAMGSA